MTIRRKQLDAMLTAVIEATIPHMTDDHLTAVIALHDKYQPGQMMTPADSQTYLTAVRAGYAARKATK